ncbi:MAG: hypothetical protein JOZ15_12135, partial [Acidobacteria bacterium]|nr:hypothetical protein [Acidobacteriota bacterium]
MTQVALLEGGALLVGFFAVCLYKLVMGDISLSGLLCTKDPRPDANHAGQTGDAAAADGEAARQDSNAPAFSPAR